MDDSRQAARRRRNAGGGKKLRDGKLTICEKCVRPPFRPGASVALLPRPPPPLRLLELRKEKQKCQSMNARVMYYSKWERCGVTFRGTGRLRNRCRHSR